MIIDSSTIQTSILEWNFGSNLLDNPSNLIHLIIYNNYNQSNHVMIDCQLENFQLIIYYTFQFRILLNNIQKNH
jgi:hypothetical protein